MGGVRTLRFQVQLDANLREFSGRSHREHLSVFATQDGFDIMHEQATFSPPNESYERHQYFRPLLIDRVRKTQADEPDQSPQAFPSHRRTRSPKI